MIVCPYEDLFPCNNDAVHEKWNTEWNEKNCKLKENKPDAQPWKENDRCKRMKLLSTDSELAIH